jgi:glutamyl/glutaminyl-tRNA synthetase
MRPINTRFNPTTDGDLHLGHVYVAAVNEYVAHSTGGKFVLRLDDNQPIWNLRMTAEEIAEFSDRQLEDLRWMGLNPDVIHSDRAMEIKENHKITKLIIDLNGGELQVPEMVMVNNSPYCTYTDMVPYPYLPWITAKKVVADFLDEIGMLIRGEDLITESSLYAFFCDLWRIPQPIQVYVGRLVNYDGSELSKTRGRMSIRSLREKGWTPNKVWGVLRETCLIYKDGPWSLDNILQSPRLTDEALVCGS